MPRKAKTMCSGCRNNFYNGNNSIGVKECWSFKSAKVVKRVRVGIWERPPYDKARAEHCLSCFSPDGYVMLQLDDSRVTSNVERWRKLHAS